MAARTYPVGRTWLMVPQEQDIDRDWLAVVVPAWRGHVAITVRISWASVDGALAGMESEEDVKAFLEAHRPWLGVRYELH